MKNNISMQLSSQKERSDLALRLTRTDSEAKPWKLMCIPFEWSSDEELSKGKTRKSKRKQLVKCITRWPGGHCWKTPQHLTLKCARNIKQHFCSYCSTDRADHRVHRPLCEENHYSLAGNKKKRVNVTKRITDPSVGSHFKSSYALNRSSFLSHRPPGRPV